ncbi:amidohydrolase family protein [Engelhardtia mirabilis]|uniref:Isoaspartyl dipeptidase n=1 Tax=Engelhardtia mirabilis TaxID=2528011 RepID=A0A518BGM7_9BACT|nr:isoaspartyl dipeptidase [Planctomycetes bacterium Pla133]QDV00447.1 isoaspartyl dipeptidase [Planctomycetes bacterium Pla86]
MTAAGLGERREEEGVAASTRSTSQRRPWALLVLAWSLLPACGSQASDPQPRQVDLALTDVALVDLDAGVVFPSRTVLVDAGRIVVVGPAGEVAAFAASTTIAGEGAYLLPGLWDMHVHDSDDAVVLAAHLAAGVTGVRDLGGPGSATVVARDKVAAGQWRGPRIVAAGPHLDGRPDVMGDGSRIQINDEAQARLAVADLARMGVDLIKVHDVMTPEVHRAVAAAAAEFGLPVDGHAPRGVPIAQVTEFQRTIEHATTLGEQALGRDALESAATFERDLEAYLAADGRGAALIAALVASGTAYCSTLVAGEGLARASAPNTTVWDDPRLAAAPEGTAARWREWLPVELLPANFHAERVAVERAARRIVGAMHERGVLLLAGTDAGAPHVYWGSALHEELDLLVEAGLEPVEALRCATVNPARVLGLEDESGAIAPGYRADLLLVEGNPLDDLDALQHIRAVIARGAVVVDRTEPR